MISLLHTLLSSVSLVVLIVCRSGIHIHVNVSFAYSRSLTSNFDNQNAKSYFVVFAPYMQVYHVWINHQSAKSQSLFSWLANRKSSFSRKSKTLTGRTLYPRSFAYVRFTGSLHVYSVVQWSQNWSNGLDTTTLRVYSIVQFAQYLSSGLYTTNRFFRIRTSARFEISMQFCIHFSHTFHTLFTLWPKSFICRRGTTFYFDFTDRICFALFRFFFSFFFLYFILFTHTFSIWFRPFSFISH